MDSRHYPKAPITEALLDLRVECAPPPSLAMLESFCERQAEAYPDKKKLIAFSAELAATPDAPPSAKTTRDQTGFMCAGPARVQVFQARFDGFSFSRLAPYQTWEAFQSEAQRLWEQFKTAVGVSAVTRIGLRYINRLDLPLPVKDFADYLVTVPRSSQQIEGAVAGFFMQLRLAFPAIEASGLVNEAIIPPVVPNTAAIVLDIDVFRELYLTDTAQGLWAVVETLREKKNEIFEASLTDRSRALFL